MNHRTVVLSETDSRKYLLARCVVGPPFVPSVLASDADAAVSAADRVGLPVSVKGVSAGLAHKAAVGAVANDLRSLDEVDAACRSMATSVQAAGLPLDGFQVQPFARAGTDLFLSAMYDMTFGVCCVVGRGGGDVESNGSLSFIRAADISEQTVRDALAGAIPERRLAAWSATTTFADFVQLARELARLVEVEPDVRDIELNPVRLVPDDSLVVLDALVTLDHPHDATNGRAPDPDEQRMIAGVLRGLAPRSVAVVGVSRNASGNGYGIVRMISECGFDGELFVIHPAAREVHGLRATSFDALADGSRIDVVVVTVPRARCPASSRTSSVWTSGWS
ncbi:acetate--CoA ligase family protein [Blastococcus brunescens]|uniref:Acetate--CoA ligase family protein n=1 Tax=Blastococcus brunescens TaxID=1564165 RepID=A0ABZ1B6B9_9ACTN|nr:acetate--CoA ligase family protein [Blastococcus sp. BMG 8361]WRL65408.1 acetate--CoA ligase family protein [Blastococcus sp. BMG 8361]